MVRASCGPVTQLEWRNSTNTGSGSRIAAARSICSRFACSCSRSLAVKYAGYCMSTPPILPASTSGVERIDEQLEAAVDHALLGTAHATAVRDLVVVLAQLGRERALVDLVAGHEAVRLDVEGEPVRRALGPVCARSPRAAARRRWSRPRRCRSARRSSAAEPPPRRPRADTSARSSSCRSTNRCRRRRPPRAHLLSRRCSRARGEHPAVGGILPATRHARERRRPPGGGLRTTLLRGEVTERRPSGTLHRRHPAQRCGHAAAPAAAPVALGHAPLPH